jgi:hypothetical protein
MLKIKVEKCKNQKNLSSKCSILSNLSINCLIILIVLRFISRGRGKSHINHNGMFHFIPLPLAELMNKRQKRESDVRGRESTHG